MSDVYIQVQINNTNAQVLASQALLLNLLMSAQQSVGALNYTVTQLQTIVNQQTLIISQLQVANDIIQNIMNFININLLLS